MQSANAAVLRPVCERLGEDNEAQSRTSPLLPMEVAMPKLTLTPAQITELLKFRLRWIVDPVPDYRRYLDKATLSKLTRAKIAFGKQVDDIIANRPR